MDNAEIIKSIKRTFLTGLFVTFPLALTIITAKWLFRMLDNLLGEYLNEVLGSYYITGLGLIISLAGIYLMGVTARTVFGRQVINATENFILRLPVVKTFYHTFKQLGEAFSPENKSSFKKFVLVEYPRDGVQSFGFLTKECTIHHADDEHFYSAVYIPTNHLYIGDIRLFKKEEVMDTNLSIEEGIKIILSAGIMSPNMIYSCPENQPCAGNNPELTLPDSQTKGSVEPDSAP